MKKPVPPSPIEKPLLVEAADHEVVVTIPDDGSIILTPDAAEMSGIRLLDAADRARQRS